MNSHVADMLAGVVLGGVAVGAAVAAAVVIALARLLGLTWRDVWAALRER